MHGAPIFEALRVFVNVFGNAHGFKLDIDHYDIPAVVIAGNDVPFGIRYTLEPAVHRAFAFDVRTGEAGFDRCQD